MISTESLSEPSTVTAMRQQCDTEMQHQFGIIKVCKIFWPFILHSTLNIEQKNILKFLKIPDKVATLIISLYVNVDTAMHVLKNKRCN